MKCWHITEQRKHKLSSIAKKEIQEIVDGYFKLSSVVGHKKALEMMKAKDKTETEESEEEKPND